MIVYVWTEVPERSRQRVKKTESVYKRKIRGEARGPGDPGGPGVPVTPLCLVKLHFG